MILLSLCNLPVWLLWLLWLLPLLFALWLWWYFDKKHKKAVAEYEDKIKGLNGTIDGLEEDLASCKSKRSEIESDLALTKGRMREMEAEMRSSKSSIQDEGASGQGLGFASGSDPRDASTEKGSKEDSVNLDALTSSLSSTDASSSDSTDTSASGAAFAAAGAKSIYSGIKSDNLQIIEGIGPKMEGILKENGVNSHSDLGNKTESEIRAILDKYGDRYKIIDPKMWATQAALAGAGKFDELIDYQKKQGGNKNTNTGRTDSKLEKFLIKTGALKAFKQDDLKAIEGIGPATDKLLRENGINSWRELANTSVEKLQEILTAAGSRFGLSDPGTWPKQAELAADGKFDELREYQDFLDGGKA